MGKNFLNFIYFGFEVGPKDFVKPNSKFSARKRSFYSDSPSIGIRYWQRIEITNIELSQNPLGYN